MKTIKHRDVSGNESHLLYREGSGGTVEIYDIVVMSERRKGVGRALIAALFDRVQEETHLVWAITRSDNMIAQQFYEALQFRVVAVLREFYSNTGDVDAIMYGRSPRGSV